MRIIDVSRDKLCDEFRPKLNDCQLVGSERKRELLSLRVDALGDFYLSEKQEW